MLKSTVVLVLIGFVSRLSRLPSCQLPDKGSLEFLIRYETSERRLSVIPKYSIWIWIAYGKT